MMRVVVLSLVFSLACSKPSSDAGGKQASYLTVGAYCTAFCTKLCGTCGAGAVDCPGSCNNRCDHGRGTDMVLDGKDPKVALALTQQNLDACLALITKDSCMSIASGNVPPACFTIQH